MKDAEVEGLDTPRIFICYRSEDSSELATKIYDKLADHFGKSMVFRVCRNRDGTTQFGLDDRSQRIVSPHLVFMEDASWQYSIADALSDQLQQRRERVEL